MGEFHGNQHTGHDLGDYTYSDLIADTQALAEKLGKPPTTREAQQADCLPSLATLYSMAGDDGWIGVLEDANLSQNKLQVDKYGPEEKSEMCTDMRRVVGQLPTDRLTTRAYRKHGGYATSTVKGLFGSWKEACAEAGINPGKKHGHNCEGPTGAELESKLELKIAQFLHEHEISYTVHPEIDGTPWTSDFLLPNSDLWIEVDGYLPGSRPNAKTFEEKLEYIDSQNIDYLVISDTDELQSGLRSKGIV
jgi:hypothetical protein